MLLDFYISNEGFVIDGELDDDNSDSLCVNITPKSDNEEFDIRIPSLEIIKELFDNIKAWGIKSVTAYINIEVLMLEQNEYDESVYKYKSHKCIITRDYQNCISFNIVSSGIPPFKIRQVTGTEMIEKENVEKSFYIYIP